MYRLFNNQGNDKLVFVVGQLPTDDLQENDRYLGGFQYEDINGNEGYVFNTEETQWQYEPVRNLLPGTTIDVYTAVIGHECGMITYQNYLNTKDISGKEIRLVDVYIDEDGLICASKDSEGKIWVEKFI